jgi:hypothetical protein
LSVDTYVILPTGSPANADKLLQENPELDEESTQRGVDFVAWHATDRFGEVQRDRDGHGERYAQQLPAWLRRKLDARGLLAVAEVGQRFEGVRYAELAADPRATWLPITRKARRPRVKRLLLIGLSRAREKLIVEDPELVPGLALTHCKGQHIPESLEVEHWVDVQRMLFDAMLLESGSDEDRRADAVTPRGGLPLYEDESVDGAKLVGAPEVARIAEWLASLPADVVARVHALPKRSDAARRFPDSLGAAPADDTARARVRAPESSAAASAELQHELERLLAFYGALKKHEKAVLSIRFRAPR